MGDIDFFSDLLPSKAPAPAPGLDGIDDIFAEESPVLAQPLSGSPHSAPTPTQTNGDLGGSLGEGSPFERTDRATSESGRGTTPMGLSTGKRDAQHVEAVLARFATGLEKVLQASNQRIGAMESKLNDLTDSLDELRRDVGSQHSSAGARWVSLEAAVRELSRGVQMVRDKQELRDTQTELSRFSTKSPSASSQAASAPEAPTALPVAAATALPPPPAAVATAPAASAPSAPPALQQHASLAAPPIPLAGPQNAQLDTQQQQQQQVQQPQVSAPQYAPQYGGAQLPLQGLQQQPSTHLQQQPSTHLQQPQQQQQQQQQHYNQQQPQVTPVPQYGAATQAQPAAVQPPYESQASPMYSAPPLPFAGREAPPVPPFGYPGAPPQQAQQPAGHPQPQNPYSQGPMSVSSPHAASHSAPPPSFPPSGGPPMQRYDSGPAPGGPPQAQGGQQPPPHQYGPPPPHMQPPPQSRMGAPPQQPPPAGLWRGPQPTPGQYNRALPSQAPPQAPPSSAGSDTSSRRVDLPLDRVIDDVAGMGFSRHEVRDVVVAMMQSGQAVDLNLVVDRLMSRNQ